MKIRPLQDRVIVERVEAVEKSAGGLYIPDTAKECLAAPGVRRRLFPGNPPPERERFLY